MQIRSKFVVTVVSLLGAVGCGDDGGGGGVAANKDVTELSASEARSFCSSLETRTDKLASASTTLSCTFMGLLASGGDKAKCETSLDQCERSAADGEGQIDCSDTSGGVTTDCKGVTVGEINDCYDALEAAIAELNGKVSCSSKIQDVSSLSTSMKPPEACVAIQTKCPDVADMVSP